VPALPPNEVAGPVALSNAPRGNWPNTEKTKAWVCSIAARWRRTRGTLRASIRAGDGVASARSGGGAAARTLQENAAKGKGIAEALYETGYGSTSRVYESSNAQLGMTPANLSKGREGHENRIRIAKSSLGKILVGATERGISAVYLGDADAKLVDELREEYPKGGKFPLLEILFERWVKEIVHRVEGNPPRLELRWICKRRQFQRRVWQELQRIPRGTTRTYTQVHGALGIPKSVRAVAKLAPRIRFDCGALPSGHPRDGSLAGIAGAFARSNCWRRNGPRLRPGRSDGNALREPRLLVRLHARRVFGQSGLNLESLFPGFSSCWSI